jgi:hypothetical protein
VAAKPKLIHVKRFSTWSILSFFNETDASWHQVSKYLGKVPNFEFRK